MTEDQRATLRDWIRKGFVEIESWYEALPESFHRLADAPVAQASRAATHALGFPVSAVDFVGAWDEVAEQVRRALRGVCTRFEVRELSVFGSAVPRAPRADSDIDLLVAFQTGARVGFLALARLSGELSTLLGRQVDLVVKDGLNPRIRDEVLARQEVLFAA
jgi:hypothetical protein